MESSTHIGIEIGGTKLQMVSGTGDGVIHDRVRLDIARDRGAAGIREQIANELPRLIELSNPRAIGVGFGGPVNWRSGQVALSHQIEGWSEFPLTDWLEEISNGIPAFADNDANVACLGEALRGAGEGCDPVFYVTMGSGVGGGLVTAGDIFHGAGVGETEIGHIRLDRSGRIVESSSSGWAVDRKIRDAIQREPDGRLAQLAGTTERGQARFLAEAVRYGDGTAAEILKSTATDLAFALSHVTHLVHPEIVILGGGLSLVDEPLSQAVAAALPEFLMEAFRPGPKIALAGLGEDVVPVGALLLAEKRLKSRATSRV